MPHFLYFLWPPRPDFAHAMREAEAETMGRHFAHLQRELAAGRLVLAGPCEDGHVGVAVIEASDLEAARAAMQADPAIAEGVVRGELHPFRLSLWRGREG